MEAATALKEEGNGFFKDRQLDRAAEAYNGALEALSEAAAGCASAADGVDALRAAVLSNRAAVWLAMDPPRLQGCVDDCTACLEIEGAHVKALFRRAKALQGLARDDVRAAPVLLDRASADLRKLLSVDSQNRTAATMLQTISKAVVKLREGQRDYKALVGQVADADTGLRARMDAATRLVGRYLKVQGERQAMVDEGGLSAVLGLLETVAKAGDVDGELFALRALCTMLGDRRVATPEVMRGGVGALARQCAARLVALPPAEDNQPLTRVLAHMCSCVGLRAEMASVRPELLDALLDALPATDMESLQLDNVPVWDEWECAKAEAALKALAIIAQGSFEALQQARKAVPTRILFGAASHQQAIYETLLVCVSAVCGPLKSAVVDDNAAAAAPSSAAPAAAAADTDADADAAGDTIKSKESAFRNGLAQFIVFPLLTDNTPTFVRAARALSILLQAVPDLGQFIVLHGSKAPTRTAASTPGGSIGVAGAAGSEEEEAGTVAPALEMLLFRVESASAAERKAAAEVLALASTDATVRATIQASGQLDVFLDLLDSESVAVGCHAALTLSKQVAVGAVDDISRAVLGDQLVLRSMIQVVQAEARLEGKQEQEQQAAPSDPAAGAAGAAGAGAPAKQADNAKTGSSDHVRMAVESIAYLSVHVSTKKALVASSSSSNGGGGGGGGGGQSWLELLLSLQTVEDRSVRFGLVQIIQNVCSSSEDVMRGFQKEVEELKKMANKGLPNPAQTNEELAAKAGSPAEVLPLKIAAASVGAVRALDKMVAIALSSTGLPPSMAQGIADAMLNLSNVQELRGLIVQQRGLRLLLKLLDLKFSDDKVADHVCENSAVAMARVAISTNPALYPEQVAVSMVAPLVHLAKNASHELFEFETCLALANLALDKQALDKMVELQAWQACQLLLTSENEMVQRAALQVLTNMVTSPKILDRLVKSGDQDIKLFVMFSRVDDVDCQIAATGALAMLSGVPALAAKICEQEGLQTLRAISLLSDNPAVMERVHHALVNLEEHLASGIVEVGDSGGGETEI